MLPLDLRLIIIPFVVTSVRKDEEVTEKHKENHTAIFQNNGTTDAYKRHSTQRKCWQ